MDKEHILNEIRRTAAANGGTPLGTDRFAQETGIRLADWHGKLWARWGDALQEAGFKPNELQGAYPDELLIEKLIAVTRELGRVPVYADLRMRAAREKSFPSHNVFHRLGTKRQLVAKVLAYCQARSGFEDVIALCTAEARSAPAEEPTERLAAPETIGFVYLLKAGKHFKVGRTNALGCRGAMGIAAGVGAHRPERRSLRCLRARTRRPTFPPGDRPSGSFSSQNWQEL